MGAVAGVRKRSAVKVPRQAGARSRLSDEAIARNLNMPGKRESVLRRFGMELRDKKDGLDPKVRSVSIKFTQLPFGFISDSCGGHFSNKRLVCSGYVIFPRNIEPGKPLYFRGANFEMHLDHSPEADEFRAELRNIEKKHSFVEFTDSGGTQMDFGILNTYKLDNMKDVQECKNMNRQFLSDFEKVVDRFVNKYGIGRQRLKKR